MNEIQIYSNKRLRLFPRGGGDNENILMKFKQNFLQNQLSGFNFVQMKGHSFFQGEIVMKLQKYIDNI